MIKLGPSQSWKDGAIFTNQYLPDTPGKQSEQ